MRVAVIGKGTASIITVLNLLKDNHQVTVFSDPNTPHINVGESTTVQFAELLWNVLGISLHDLVNAGICSYKNGIEFDKWGKGKKFHHHFIDNKVAFHFETQDFNKFINSYLINTNKIKYIAKKVEKYDTESNIVKIHNEEFDFVINCAGWKDSENYYEPIFETVNTAILFRKHYPEYSKHHTLHLATEDGWQFGLPFPKKDVHKCGYLFNRNYISKEEAIKKLPKDCEVYQTYEWQPRYRKKLIENKFFANNGNRLFFFEPLQAMTLHYSNEFAMMICEYLKNPTEQNKDRLNLTYLDGIYSQQLCLAYHYHFGSVYKTSFWKDKTKKAKFILNNSIIGTGEKFLESVRKDYDYKTNDSKLAWMVVEDHIYIHNGMNNIKWNGLLKQSLPK